MLRIAGLAATLGLLLVVGPARAEDTFTIRLKSPATGDVIAATEDESENGKMTIKDGSGKVVTDSDTKETKVFVYREEILEKESGKKPTKLRRTYEKAEVTKKGATMKLLYQGKTVMIEKKDGKYHYMIGNIELTGDDAKYLAKEFAKEEDDSAMEKLFVPTKAVAVNESWKLDAELIAKAMSGDQAEMDAAKSSGTGKLVKVYKRGDHLFGVMEFQIDMALKTMGKAPNKIVMQPGSKFSITITMEDCIDGSLVERSLTTKMQGTGDGTLTSGGTDYKITVAMHNSQLKTTRQLKK